MATVTKGYTFGSTEQVTATKLHNLVDLATVGGLSLSDFGEGFLGSMATTSGQMRYFNLIQSLASGAYVIYNGSFNFMGTSLTIPLASVPSSSSNQYWSPRFLATLSVNWDNGNVQYLTLASGAQSISLSNPKDGGRYALLLKQASGYGAVSMPTIVLWPNATYSALATTSGKVDILTLLYDSANTRYYGAMTGAF